MAVNLDTLVFTQRLRAAGVDQGHAEAHAEAARDVILANAVSQSDLKSEFAQLRAELKAFEEALINRITKLVATIMIGVVTVAGAALALLLNLGKLLGH